MLCYVNSLTTKKQTTKFSSANFQKLLNPSYIILRTQRLERANSANLSEVAYHEPPHQDLCCFQIQLFSSLVSKEFMGLNIVGQVKGHKISGAILVPVSVTFTLILTHNACLILVVCKLEISTNECVYLKYSCRCVICHYPYVIKVIIV